MKKMFFLFMCLFSLSPIFAQDNIILKNGDELKSKILEVATTEIKYSKFDNPTGPIYTILKSDVFMIKYENGSKDTFAQTEKAKEVDPTNENLFAKGQMDASKYYKGYTGAGAGTLVVSLLSPIVGLVPAIACSSTPPNDANLTYPNSDLMKKTDYYNGYTSKSKRIKSGKVWKNWGVAFGVNLVLTMILMSGN
jgi:hypothetical protein